MAKAKVIAGFDKRSVQRVTRNADAYVVSKRDDIKALITKYVNLIMAEAQGIVPVDTGLLRSTIRRDLAGLANKLLLYGDVIGGSGAAFYAGFVEFGTVKMAAQPFMRPAYMKHEEAFKRELAALVKRP